MVHEDLNSFQSWASGTYYMQLQPSVYPLCRNDFALVPNGQKDFYCVSCLVSAF